MAENEWGNWWWWFPYVPIIPWGTNGVHIFNPTKHVKDTLYNPTKHVSDTYSKLTLNSLTLKITICWLKPIFQPLSARVYVELLEWYHLRKYGGFPGQGLAQIIQVIWLLKLRIETHGDDWEFYILHEPPHVPDKDSTLCGAKVRDSLLVGEHNYTIYKYIWLRFIVVIAIIVGLAGHKCNASL